MSLFSRTKRELRATEDKIADTARKAQEIIEAVSKEGRSRTDDENAEVAECHKTLETLKEHKRDLEDQLEVERDIQASVKEIDPEPSGLPPRLSKPRLSYRARAAVSSSAVLSSIQSAPRARATSSTSFISARPSPRPRSGGTT